jgi:hypothetical protein
LKVASSGGEKSQTPMFKRQRNPNAQTAAQNAHNVQCDLRFLWRLVLWRLVFL